MYLLFILCGVSIVPFIFTLNGDFVFDDSEAIVKNKDIVGNSSIDPFSNDFWGTDIKSNLSHKSYRPLSVITFRLNYILSGYTLIPYHFKVTNLICHLICTIVVWYSYKALIVGANTFKKNSSKGTIMDLDFLAALLFAVHPIHTEAVSGIVGRADVLAAITYFSCFLCYHKAITYDLLKRKRLWLYLIASLTFALTSMLFKENGVTVLGFCLIYEFLVNPNLHDYMSHVSGFRNKNKLKNKNYSLTSCLIRLNIVLISIFIFLLMRWYINGKSVPQFKHIDNPAAFSDNFFSKVATYNYLYVLNILLFIWPQWLCFDWSMGCVPLVKEIMDYRIIFVMLLYSYIIVLIKFVSSKKSSNFYKRLVTLSLAAMIVPFLPAANIFLTVGFVLAERVLYIPSAGYCLLIAIGFRKLSRSRKWKVKAVILYLYLLLIYGMKTADRSNDWKDEYSLFTSGLQVCPLNAKVHYNIAKVADAKNKTEWSLYEYREAIRLYPDYYQAMNNLANLLKNQQKYREAEIYLKKAISLKHDFPAAWMNLGIVYASIRRFKESENAYLTAISYRKKYSDCFYNLGNLYLLMNKTEEAINAWNESIQLNSKHILAWNNLLTLLDNSGQIEKSIEFIPKALIELPDIPSIHFVAANVYGKMGRYKIAEEHFNICIKLFGNRVQAVHHANLGVLYHRWKKYYLAMKQYDKALSIDPLYKSALNNMKSLNKLLNK